MIVNGVPTGMSFASFRMSAFLRRTQPCEIRPGINPGVFVPCTPTTPPPGQSVSVGDVALVMNAIGPKTEPAPPNFSSLARTKN